MKPKIIYRMLPLDKKNIPLLTELLNTLIDYTKDVIWEKDLNYNTWIIDAYEFGINKKYKSHISYNFFIDGKIKYQVAGFNHTDNELTIHIPDKNDTIHKTITIDIDKYY